METRTELYQYQSLSSVHSHIQRMRAAGWAVRFLQRHEDSHNVVDWLVVYEREASS